MTPKQKETIRELLTEVSEYNKDYSSTRHKLIAKGILKDLDTK
jgi:hypothetical protein